MTPPYKILVKFPIRSRPQKFLDALNNMQDTADDLTNIHFLVTIDDDDDSMKWALKAKFPKNVQVVSGVSKSKIDAINRDMELAPDWDICVQTSDDMRFLQRESGAGWDTQIRNDYAEFFPDLDGAMHYPDGYKNEDLITLTIVAKNWYKRFGYLYYPKYKSFHSDDELTCVAKMLGKYKYVPITLFLHEHSFWLGTPEDDLLKKAKLDAVEDKELFDRRKAINFGLTLGDDAKMNRLKKELEDIEETKKKNDELAKLSYEKWKGLQK